MCLTDDVNRFAFVEYESRRDADDAYHEMHNKRIGRDDLLKIEVWKRCLFHAFRCLRHVIQWARTPPSASWRFDAGRPARDGARSPRRRRSGERSERSPPRRRYDDDREGGERRDDRDRGDRRERRDRDRSRSPEDRDRDMKDRDREDDRERERDRDRDYERENGTNGEDRKGTHFSIRLQRTGDLTCE